MVLWIWLGSAGFLLGIVAVLYNRLVRHRNLVREAWSGIEVQLKMRHNLVPNLVEAVRGYVRHEREVLEEVTRLRARCETARDPADAESAEAGLSEGLKSMLAVAEGYPDLKASETFLKLQHELVAVEDRLQKARRYYNGAVRDYNIQLESFPSVLVANAFAFKPRDFFEVDAAVERAAPTVRFEAEGDPV